MLIFDAIPCVSPPFFPAAAVTLALLKARCAITWSPKRNVLARASGLFTCNRLIRAVGPASRLPRLQMATGANDEGQGPGTNSDMKQLMEKVHKAIAEATKENGWDTLWKEGIHPWDVGNVTPVIQDLIERGELPDGRALVPGCGSGYDVITLANKYRHVVGLDISETVIKKAKQMAAENEKEQWAEFLVADFFNYAPEAPFNLIFDYTFFCAIDPSLRPAWAAKIAALLAEDGELITLMFPLGDFSGGPPYAVSEKDYDDVLHPHGIVTSSCEDNKLAVPERQGMEKIAHWHRKLASSKF